MSRLNGEVRRKKLQEKDQEVSLLEDKKHHSSLFFKMLAQRGEAEPQAADAARLQHVLSLRRSCSGFVLQESVPHSSLSRRELPLIVLRMKSKKQVKYITEYFGLCPAFVQSRGLVHPATDGLILLCFMHHPPHKKHVVNA